MASPSVPQSSTYATQPNRSLLFRQVDYYDGKSVCIAESRRRPHVIRTGTTTPSSTHVPPEASRDRKAESSIECAPGQTSPVRTSSSKEPRLISHVTSKPQRTKANLKTIIVQAPVPTKLEKAYGMQRVDVEDFLTPPPTPKIKRLPTPDLDNSDERPFCDCCIEAHTFKLCTSCGHGLDSTNC